MSSFKVKYSALKSNGSEIKSISSDLRKIEAEIESVSKELSGMQGADEAIRNSLSTLKAHLGEKTTDVAKFSTVLADCAILYKQAEKSVSARKISIDSKGVGNSIAAIVNGVIDAFFDWLRKIGIIPGGSNDNRYHLVGEPVNVCTGNFVSDETDISFSGSLKLEFTRHYNAMHRTMNTLGMGWSHNFEMLLEEDEDSLNFHMGDQWGERFCKTENGVYLSAAGSRNYIHADGERYVLLQRYGNSYIFDADKRIKEIISPDGCKLEFFYEDGKLKRVQDLSERYLDYSYDNDLLTKVTDNIGRCVSFEYEGGLLTRVISADKASKTYGYDDQMRLISMTDGRGITVLTNEYDEKNRVVKQSFPDETYMTFEYNNEEVVFTDRNRVPIKYIHDEKYQIRRIIRPDGEESYEFNDAGQRVKYRNIVGAEYCKKYDDKGNLIEVTDPLGNSLIMKYEESSRPVWIKQRSGGISTSKYNSDGDEVEHSDELGNITRMEYAGRKLTRIINPDGSCESFEYDECGNIAAYSDACGNVTRYEYDGAGRKILETDPEGNATSFAYDECDRLIKVTNALGKSIIFSYDAAGKLEKQVDFGGRETTWEYDALGYVICNTRSDGVVVRYSYDAMHNVSEIEMQDGGVQTIKYDNMNRKVEETDDEGLTTRYEYDPAGRVLRKTVGSTSRSFEYDACGNVISVLEKNGGKRISVYDEDGHVISMTDPVGGSYSYKYDDAGQCVSKTDATGSVTSYEYDCRRRISAIYKENLKIADYEYYPNGNMAKVSYPDGRSMSMKYDKCGNVIEKKNQDGYCLWFTYDAIGRRTGMTDSAGRKSIYLFDDNNNITQKIDAAGNVTEYTYTDTDMISSVTDPMGHVVAYGYDFRGWLTSIDQNPMMKDGVKTQIERDRRGRITSITNAYGIARQYKYDTEGRMIESVDPSGNITRYRYTQTGQTSEIQYPDGKSVRFDYDIMDRMSGFEDWAGRTSFEYDLAGRLISFENAAKQRISYTWDRMNRKTGVRYPDGRTIKFDYLPSGKLGSITGDNLDIHYSYDSSGKLAQKKTGNNIVSYSYLSDGRVYGIEFRDGTDCYLKEELEYDILGNVVQKARTEPGKGKSEIKYLYDEAGRLITVVENGSRKRDYQYDYAGNRILSKCAGSEIVSKYNKLNQLISQSIISNEGSHEVKWAYDNKGNTIFREEGGERLEYSYDASGNLTEVLRNGISILTFTYDGLGTRLSERMEDGSEKKFIFDPSCKYNGLLSIIEGDLHTDYVYDGQLTAELGSEGARFFHCDTQGSVKGYLSDDGKLIGSYNYDEFGCDMVHAGSEKPPFGYIGLMRDGITGLLHTRTRSYIPSGGRFLQKDKEQFIHIQNPGSINLYTYCLNNPLIYIDPSGEDLYYFYLPEWKSEAVADRTSLAKAYGCSEDKIHLVPVSNAQELTDGWNSMGTENGHQVDIETVIINSHANPEVLGFGNSGADSFTLNDISNLQNKDMDQLLLYGCNAGHTDYADDNVASRFSQKTNGAPVMASDGTVSMRHNDGDYTGQNDEEFQKWAGRAGNGGRDNSGWQIYQQVDGQTVVTTTGEKSRSCVDMLDEIDHYKEVCGK